MTSIPKIYRLGERFTENIFDGHIVIEEKIDGSQFSFTHTNGKLVCRSKTTEINEADPGMFRLAVEKARSLATMCLLIDGATYQCEFLAKPKHNVLAYGRVPAGNLVLFDIRMPDGAYLWTGQRTHIAKTLELEPVPVLFEGTTNEFQSPDVVQVALAKDSVLGNVPIEGVVIKNYGQQHGERPNHPKTAKVVSDRFKERQACKPMKVKPEGDDRIQPIVNALRTEARWVKAVGHLRDAGALTNSTKDIGVLIKEINQDLVAEETDWIKQQLYDAFSKDIYRGVVHGFAQWYQKIIAAGGLSVYQDTLANEKQGTLDS